MECPSDEELRSWLDGGRDATTSAAVEAHLDQCTLCHAVVAAVAKTEVPDGERSAVPPVLRRGGSIGRYRILGVLGAGSMGVVYAARDEILDRTVAVKLLRSAHASSEEAAARLEREAQAMARVSHPNVVAVYEVGTYDDAPFVAMEYVDGVTLSDWLSEHRPKLDELLRLFREAAVGLHAVHRAGLVHRDFKPANVLVSRDGRVRIADFGLVHIAAGAPPAWPDVKESAESRFTADGAVIGTPAYLAPEQLQGRVDARSDQFSFCVALFEACFGQRPFQADTLEELGAAVRSGALRLPKVLPRGTRWLVPILRRGLAYDPAARFPDLAALVAALSRSPARRRRAALAGAVLLPALLFAVTASRGPDCGTIEHGLDGVWDEPRRQAIRAAFLSQHNAHAEEDWKRVSAAVDAYAAAWLGRRRESCLRPGKDDAERDRVVARVACLDRRLTELHIFSDLLASSDVDAVENAPQAVMELRSPDQCEREAVRIGVLSTDQQSLLDRLAKVRLLSSVGRYKVALDLARSVLPASELGGPAIHAKALLRSGQLELRRSLEVGIAQLRQAALLAETAHDDETRAEALTLLAFAMSQHTAPSDLALGEQYAEQATAVLARLGGDRRLEPMILIARGLLVRAGEHYDEAEALLERALAELDRDPMRDPRQYNRLLTALGTTLAEMGRPEDGLPLLQRALARIEGSMGAHSPTLSWPVLYVGDALLQSGRAREAAPYLERAVALAELGDGTQSRAGGATALVLGMCRDEQGDTAAARKLLERAFAISTGLASGDTLRFEVQLALGRHLTKAGEGSRARALLDQALRDAPGQETAAKARFALAQALPRAGRKRARELADQARATYVGAGARRKKEVAAIDDWLASIR